MHLKSLELKQLGSHEDSFIAFKPGINILYGPNFSGKSTVCDALHYILLGDSVRSGNVGKKMIRYGEDVANISLELTTKSGDIFVQRNIPGKLIINTINNNSRYYKRISKKADIENIYGASENVLRFSFITESEVIRFISMTKPTRRDLLYGISGIEQLEVLRDLFIENRKSSKREEKEKQTSVNAFRYKIAPDIEQRFQEAKLEKEKAQMKMDDVMAKINGVSQLVELHNYKDEVDRLTKLFNEKLTQYKDKLGDFENVASMEAFLVHTDEEAVAVEKTKSNLQNIQERIQRGYGYHQKVISQMDEMKKITDTNGKSLCPFCMQTMDDQQQRLVMREREKQKRKAELLLGELMNERDELKKQVEEMEIKINRKTDVETQRAVAKVLSVDIKTIEQRIQICKEKIANFEKDLGSSELMEESNDLKTVLEKATTTYEELLVQKKIHDLNMIQYATLIKDLEIAKQDRNICEAAVIATEKTIDKVLQRLFDDIAKDVQEIINKSGILDQYRVMISMKDYTLMVMYQDQEIDLALLSGSEKTLLYTAFKIAVALIYRNGFIVLDEPTAYLDQRRQKQFMELLDRMAAKGIQIIMTSSDERVLTPTANVIRMETVINK